MKIQAGVLYDMDIIRLLNPSHFTLNLVCLVLVFSVLVPLLVCISLHAVFEADL